ncbi:hypothetical protein ARMGADRAFT_1163305 [Armillaria gallica]|uniref:Uncharacterized protein n=1 Tax=Armillaria gallica TaxID=47427 RepID=A0A2H3E8Q0_ARMGA|nr:hypothetical protein ARMGADRAFT_1163305 [Armillaria gallica]
MSHNRFCLNAPLAPRVAHLLAGVLAILPTLGVPSLQIKFPTGMACLCMLSLILLETTALCSLWYGSYGYLELFYVSNTYNLPPVEAAPKLSNLPFTTEAAIDTSSNISFARVYYADFNFTEILDLAIYSAIMIRRAIYEATDRTRKHQNDAQSTTDSGFSVVC